MSLRDSADALKQAVWAEIDRYADEIVRVTKEIEQHPETGFKETRTARLVAETFRRIGLVPTEGIAVTGVKARLVSGSPGPNVAVMGELDSNLVPTHPLADPKTDAAHACGHPCQIGSMLGVAFGLKSSNAAKSLAGSVTFWAVPAEEYLELEWRADLRRQGKIAYFGGKPELVRLGEMDDVDFCMLTHTTPDVTGFVHGRTNNGMVGKTVRFLGKSAHAGGAPHLGVNALNAAHIALAGIHAQRESYRDEDRIRVHPIITFGGRVVNAVPDEVRLETYVRGANINGILDANAKVDRALRAGALAVGGRVEIATAAGYLPFREEAKLGAIWAENAKAIVGPDGVEVGGASGGSTDMGDLSHLLPTVQPYVGGASGRGHSEDYRIVDYDLAVVKAAKAMAGTVVDLLSGNARLASQLKAKFKPQMTKRQYLDLVDGLFTTREFSE